MTFGEKVRYTRKLMGNKSTTELAALLGIEQASVSKVENSPTRKFKRETILRLSQISGLPLRFFMDENVKTPDEVTSDPRLAQELGKHFKFLKVADAAAAAGLTEQDVLALIEVAKKIKRRDA